MGLWRFGLCTKFCCWFTNTVWPWATQNNLLFFKKWLLILTVSSFSMRLMRLELQTFVLVEYLFLIRVLINCAISVAGKLSWTLSSFIKMCQIPQSLEQSSNNGKRDPVSWMYTNMCQRRCLLISTCAVIKHSKQGVMNLCYPSRAPDFTQEAVLLWDMENKIPSAL